VTPDKSKEKLKSLYRDKLRLYLAAVAVGVLAGLSSALFLIALHNAEMVRDRHMGLLWLLPLAGFFIGWVYHRFGQDVAAGNNLVIEEVHYSQRKIPWHMTPFILVGTVLTHLFGGSAGREGTAVQMGGALADQVNSWFRFSHQERKILLAAGAGAGFAAAIGTPFAGVIFATEFLFATRLKLFAVVEAFIACFVGYYICHLLEAPHTHYPIPDYPAYTLKYLFYALLAGVAFGLAARFFTMSTRWVYQLFSRFIKYPPLKPLLSGMLLLLFYYLEGSYRFVGLGLPQIQQSLVEVSHWTDPLLKSLFTSLTIGTGFKGGEFTPLVFIGTTLGSSLSLLIPMGMGVLGSLGFAAVFAGASNTPLACTIMAVEIFGWEVAPFALIACYVSYLFSGHQGIYSSQKVGKNKWQSMVGYFS
jgi:H+/Cl- antiporter ClcA